jgi:hypothetical protein
MLNEALLKMLATAFGPQIEEAMKLAVHFKAFGDDVIARLARLENQNAAILKYLAEMMSRDEPNTDNHATRLMLLDGRPGPEL